MADTIKKNIVIVEQTFTNVGITTRSGSGAYWASVNTDLPSNAVVISANCSQWGSAAASFSTNIVGQKSIEFTSDISQTVGSITVRMLVKYT